MAFRLNPCGEGEGAKADAEAEGVEKGPSWWFHEKKGSVFPAKKKLVKTMMVENIANIFSSKIGGSGSVFSNKGIPNTSPSKSSKVKKGSTVNIFPHP